MKEEIKKEKNDVKSINLEEENKKRKEEFDSILDKIKKMSEAIELHTNVKEAVSKEEVDNNYLRYIENSLEDKFFNDAKFNQIQSSVLLEVVCPELQKIENFDVEKLSIEDIGSHFEEQNNYIDKICTYDNKFICLFGIMESNSKKVIKYEARKFSRLDIIEAICEKIEQGKTMNMQQYDEYYVVSDENSLKVFSERIETALLKLEETKFDKIKNKLIAIFNKKIFVKKKFSPNIQLVYDSNPNRFKEMKTTSKISAKKRMKELLVNERKVTRSVEEK